MRKSSFILVWVACALHACGGTAAVEGAQPVECVTDDDCSGTDACNTLLGCDTPRECAETCISAAAPRGYCGCDGLVFIGNPGCPNRKYQTFDDNVLSPDDPGREVEGTPCTM